MGRSIKQLLFGKIQFWFQIIFASFLLISLLSIRIGLEYYCHIVGVDYSKFAPLVTGIAFIFVIFGVLMMWFAMHMQHGLLLKEFSPLDGLLLEVSEIVEELKSISKEDSKIDKDAEMCLTNFITRLENKEHGNAEIRHLAKIFEQFGNLLLFYEKLSEENKHLASIGQSTAMVAHDVRKPLTSMKALLTNLPAIKDKPEELQKMISIVDGSIAHTNAMLNEILDFSRDSTALELGEHDPQSIITSALSDALRNHSGSDVKMEYDLKHEHTLHVDCNRITRVLTNIIDNALGAMANNDGEIVGRLFIRTEESKNVIASVAKPAYRTGRQSPEYNCTQEIATATAWPRNDMLLRITISDSGPGIPEEVLPKIFNPFFTLGKKGGTGLGLAICKKVIDMHGGKIEARNCAMTTGAEFIIELPIGERTAAVNEAELIYNSGELKAFREEEAMREDSGGDTANTAEFMRINKERKRLSRMLIVDDEPLFRETIRYMLNGLDQVKDHVRVVEVDSAEKGLKLFESGGFDYVIADIDLGKRKMNGYEFTQEILVKYPETYVLIHSNKRKEELDMQIRDACHSEQSASEAPCLPAGRKNLKNTSEHMRSFAGAQDDMHTSHFLGFLPKPMKSSELLQFLACRTFEVSITQNIGRPALAGESSQAEAWRPKKVLLLNDDEGLNFSIGYTLKSQNMQVMDVTNVSDALKCLTNNKFDAIISDINLGEDQPSGYDFLQEVRKSDNTIPFIFASGYSKESEWPKAKESGATAYLQLPLEPEDIKEIFK